jgi:hypothetical protein
LHVSFPIALISSLFFWSVSFAASAQSAAGVIDLARVASAEVKIDGRLIEAVWGGLTAHGDLRVVSPDVLTKPQHETTVKMFYTDAGLYVGIAAIQPPDTLVPRLSSRDAEVNRDGTQIFLDVSGEGLYGLYFGVNLGGTLSDGTLLPERQLSQLWDGAWRGRTFVTADGYTTEMFLPWSIMPMPKMDGPRRMGFAMTRRVTYLDEEWGWPALPESKPDFISGMQPLALEQIQPRQQLALFPFAAASANNIRRESNTRVGMDIFWRPSSRLQLTSTLNPDFGIVESDDVVVNLTAFETYFPEKRLFFLEGNDVFVTSSRAAIRQPPNSAGARPLTNTFFSPPTTLVNTRRIGGAPRTPVVEDGVTLPGVELSKPTELLGAVKATGQSGAFRYGVMAAAEDDTTFFGTRDVDGRETALMQTGRDFSVARLLYENTQGGRKSLGGIATLVADPEGDARTYGVDAKMRSKSGRVSTEVQLMASDVESTRGAGGYVEIDWAPRQGSFHRLSFDYIDADLDISDMGFLRRNDSRRLHYFTTNRVSNVAGLRQLGTAVSLSYEQNMEGKLVQSSFFIRSSMTFQNRSKLDATMIMAPARWEDRRTRGNGDYRTAPQGTLAFEYGTDTSGVWSAAVGANVRSEELGDTTITGQFGVTYKPNDRMSIELDATYRNIDGWLIYREGDTLATYEGLHWQPKLAMDLFLSVSQQLRFSLQWVGIRAKAQNLWRVPAGGGDLLRTTLGGIQDSTHDFTTSRLTSQLRYRWEIAPLSDLFVVYTRGSNLPSRGHEEFGDLFHDALTDPVVDLFVVKLRYRFSR